MIAKFDYAVDGWEIKASPPPLAPGQKGQHTNGPCAWWARRDNGQWELLPWRCNRRLSKFYACNGRWPAGSEDEYEFQRSLSK